MEEEESRGYSRTDKAICASCFDDYAIRDFIAKNATGPVCSFCGQRDIRENIAADGNAVLAFVLRGLWSEYSDVDTEGVPYDSEDDEYIIPVYSNYDLFHEELADITDDEDVRDWLINTIHNHQWCEKDPGVLSPAQGLVAGWRDFCDAVRYKTRFLFFDSRPKRGPDEPTDIGEEPFYVYPAELLEELADAVKQLSLTTPLAAGTLIYRARPHETAIRFASATELGPPHPDQATAGRMNAAGIVVFYGALDDETALSEKPGNEAAISIGTFQLTREAQVLDLTNLPTVPCIFDRQRRQLRVPIAFIRKFHNDIIEPVQPDRQEHIEYVPTQVVTEFIKLRFTDQQGKKLDGIMYPSSQRCEGRNLVLFATQENIEGIQTERYVEPPKLLRMTESKTIARRTPL